MIVSPDVGGVVRARSLARRLDADLAIIDKRRPKAGVSEVMNIIGDVQKRHCIMVDDIVDSGGHPVQRRRRADRCRRDQRRRLCDAWRAVRRRCEPCGLLAAQLACHHRLDPGHRGGARGAQYPAYLGCAAASARPFAGSMKSGRSRRCSIVTETTALITAFFLEFSV